MVKEKKGFNLRSFTSFSLVISALVMSWSGFILYVAPPGRIANWGTWQLMLFTKTEWQALHTIFSYLFFILAIIHLFFVNWKTFLTYFKSKLRAGLNRRWELAAAIFVSAVFFAGTLRNWTPFGPVMTFGEKVKEGWEGKFEAPPVLHMETYTLEQLSPLFDSVGVSQIRGVLDKKNISTDSDTQTLREVADKNHITPSDVYNALSDSLKKETTHTPSQGQQGMGKYTIKTISENSGKSVEEIIEALKKNGIEATESTTLKEIATLMGLTPREAYDLLSAKPAAK